MRFRQWAQNADLRRHFLGAAAAAAPRAAEGPDWVPRAAGDPAAARTKAAGSRTGALGTSRPASHVVRTIELALPEGALLLGWVELRDLNWRRRTGELRICLGDPATWGRGYGAAAMELFLRHAFEAWNLRSVHLRVAVWNVRAVRLYGRCGFRREARLVAGRHARDGVEDLWLMRLDAPEWHARREVAAGAAPGRTAG